MLNRRNFLKTLLGAVVATATEIYSLDVFTPQEDTPDVPVENIDIVEHIIRISPEDTPFFQMMEGIGREIDHERPSGNGPLVPTVKDETQHLGWLQVEPRVYKDNYGNYVSTIDNPRN